MWKGTCISPDCCHCLVLEGKLLWELKFLGHLLFNIAYLYWKNSSAFPFKDGRGYSPTDWGRKTCLTVGSGGETDFNQFLKFQSYFLSLSRGRTHSRGRRQRVERDTVWIADCGMERTSEVCSSSLKRRENKAFGY
jgi:hypothetical protein